MQIEYEMLFSTLFCHLFGVHIFIVEKNCEISRRLGLEKRFRDHFAYFHERNTLNIKPSWQFNEHKLQQAWASSDVT